MLKNYNTDMEGYCIALLKRLALPLIATTLVLSCETTIGKPPGNLVIPCGQLLPMCPPTTCCQFPPNALKGTCVPGNQTSACGSEIFCVECGESTPICLNFQCVANCDPTNCLGCCNQTNECVVGTSDLQCGQGGVACIDCVQAGKMCITQNGQSTCEKCEDNRAKCAGCCKGGTCKTGNSNDGCGINGVDCVICEAPKTCGIDPTTGNYVCVDKTVTGVCAATPVPIPGGFDCAITLNNCQPGYYPVVVNNFCDCVCQPP